LSFPALEFTQLWRVPLALTGGFPGAPNEVGQLLLPGVPRTPPGRLTARGLKLDRLTALRQRDEPQHSCHSQLF